jgi:hypothetical protein
MQKEWDRLRNKRCWDESRVREWQDVAGEARRAGTKAHVGRVFGITVEKGSELDENNPMRKYKGRVVYQGNDVRDEFGDAALFQEMSVFLRVKNWWQAKSFILYLICG